MQAVSLQNQGRRESRCVESDKIRKGRVQGPYGADSNDGNRWILYVLVQKGKREDGLGKAPVFIVNRWCRNPLTRAPA